VSQLCISAVREESRGSSSDDQVQQLEGSQSAAGGRLRDRALQGEVPVSGFSCFAGCYERGCAGSVLSVAVS